MNPYFEQHILGSDPLELVRLLYKRAIACTRDAREHVRAGRIEARSRAILNAYGALNELIASLKIEAAPEIGSRLRDLYLYMQARLIAANFEQTEGPLSEVLQLLGILGEAWAHVASGGPADEARDTKGNRADGTSPIVESGRIAVSA